MRQRRVRRDKKGPQATSYPRSTSSSGANGPVTVQKMPLDANGAMGGIVGHRVRGSEESSYFLDVAGYGEGQGEAHVKAGLSTADMATTPCPRVTEGTKMKILFRSAALPGERGSAPHAENVRTVHRGPGSSSPAGPPCKFSFLRPFPQTFTDSPHALAIFRGLMIKW